MTDTRQAVGSGWWLRPAVLVLGGLETIGALYILGGVLASGQLTSGEQLSRTLAWAVMFIYLVPYLVLVVPGLVLAWRNRRLPLALALCFAAVPITYAFYQKA